MLGDWFEPSIELQTEWLVDHLKGECAGDCGHCDEANMIRQDDEEGWTLYLMACEMTEAELMEREGVLL